MSSVEAGLNEVRGRIRAAAEACGRDPSEVRLVAVSKTQPLELIDAAIGAGQLEFGENYLQDALPKLDALDAREDLRWHFIGRLQSNKTRGVAERFDWVHTVDRERIARRLDAQRSHHGPPLRVCIQVRAEGDERDSGVSAAELPALAEVIAGLPRLQLRGLMLMPPEEARGDAARPHFARLRALSEDLRERGHALDTLSMGMTGDLEAAIAEGATLVRVGTAIFGPRRTD